MPGGNFVDTNILVYSLAPANTRKQESAERLLHDLRSSANGVVSHQVMQEFANILLRGSLGVSSEQDYLDVFRKTFATLRVVWPTSALFEDAICVQTRYRFHWYDSLIIAAALEAKCDVLYTEDLQHGQRIEGLTVINPFL